jgi:DeoR family galactitol utilization operon repressor
MMKADARRQKILTFLATKGTVEIKNLVKELEASHVTIRHDLSVLEEAGKLERFSGGAALPSLIKNVQNEKSNWDSELAVKQRYKINDVAKLDIAKKAAEMVSKNATIIIDSGSTTHLLAKQLAQKGNLTIITNNLAAATTLAGVTSITLAICGGVYRSVSQSIHGNKAEEFFSEVCADIAFIGADGLDPLKGSTTFNEGYRVTQVIAECAKSVVMLADSSKLKRAGFNQVLLPEQIKILITDKNIPEEVIKRFEDNGTQVVLA